MAIHSIRIKNLLSFEDVTIDTVKDINCIVGKNNVGKSNLLKLIKYFYSKIDGDRLIPPELYSNYEAYGSITIKYDVSRIKSIVMKQNNKSHFLKHIYNVLFSNEIKKVSNDFEEFINMINSKRKKEKSFIELTLMIYRDDSIKWSIPDISARKLLSDLYPFFDIETRHIDLYEWDKVWNLVSRLNTFNIKDLSNDDLLEYMNSKISTGSNSYKNYVESVEKIISTKKYSYREKVLSYIKIGLKGHEFIYNGENLNKQSDGTNSHKFIEVLLNLLITLTRREYITPTIYIDEPEVGLHPKLSESLISNLNKIFKSFEKIGTGLETGKYKTPYPKIFMSTHSPNILKSVIKNFREKQQILHFSKSNNNSTIVSTLTSVFNDYKFLNLFSDNEARLFFSEYILFVEGLTEFEVFSNQKILDKFEVFKLVDIYMSNGKKANEINPSYTNAAIPFKVVYDADVSIALNYNKKIITYKKGFYNLNKFCSTLSYQYFTNSKHKNININSIIKNNDRVVGISNNYVEFNGFKNSNFIKMINNLSKNDCVRFMETTIEGALINKKSVRYFEYWIVDLLMDSFHFEYSDNISKQIIIQSKMISDKKKTNLEVFNSMYTKDTPNYTLSEVEDAKVKRIKRKAIYEIRKYIKSKNFSDNEKLNLYRVIFDGKTDTLLSRTNNFYPTYVGDEFKSAVKEIRTKHLKNIGFLMNKTGGWVTSFLDFSIDKMECENQDEDFYIAFSIVFSEISDIIVEASSSIE